MIVLDASLGFEWLFEQHLDWISATDDAAISNSSIIVPSHWTLEISNALRPELRAKKLSVVDLHTIMARLDLLHVRIDAPADVDEIGPLTQFAVTHDLTAYDAAYVQLALRHQATLATLDRAMRAAAANLNIPLLPAAP